MPKWYTLPPNYSRDEVTIEIIHYLKATKIITYSLVPEHKILKEQVGISRQHPISEAADEEERKRVRKGGRFETSFPRYHIITIDGIEEVFEHRDDKGTVAYLYVSDDPKITSYINSTQNK